MATDPVSPRDVVEYALLNRISLSRAADRLSGGKKKEARNLWRRVQKYVKSTPNGDELMRIFLRHGAAYDLDVAARLVCDIDEVLQVILDGDMPLVDACEGLDRERQLYQTLYNRAVRQCPERLEGLRKRETRDGEPENFFGVHHYEFGEVRR